MIHKDQLGMQMIHKDQLKCDTKTSASHKACFKLLGATPQVTYANGVAADCICPILTLPKFHLATFKLIANRWVRKLEGCPIHPTRIDSSLVFAIRLTGNIFLNPLSWNRHESFPIVWIRYTGSRFAWDLKNIPSWVHAGWVENVVRFDRIDTNRFPLWRFVIPEFDLRGT